MSEIQNSNNSRDLYSETPIKGLENIQNKALVIAPFEITKSGLLDTDLLLNTTGQITFYLYRKYATDDIDKLIDLEPTSDQFESVKTISELSSLGLVPDNSVGAAGEKDYLGSFKMNVIFKYDTATGTRTIEKDSTYYNQQSLDYVDVSVTDGELNDFSSLVDSHGTGAFFCVCRVEKQTKATNTSFTDGSETYSNYEFIFMIPSSECRDLSSSNPIVNSYDILDSNNKVINIMKQGALGSGFVLDVDNTNTPIDPSTSADFFGDGSNIATYLFEGNARDENLNYNGAATNITYALANNPKFGPGNGCAVFNGTSSSISAPASTLSLTTEGSFSFWVKTTVTGGAASDTKIILGNGGGWNTKGFSFGLKRGDWSKLRFHWQSSTDIILDSVNNINDGNWHHVVCIATSSTLTIYIDGKFDTSMSISTQNVFTGENLVFGYSPDSVSSVKWFNGSIDQVRIFNRALNYDEVTALYNNSINKYVIKQEPDQNINDLNYDFFEDGTNVGTFRFNGNGKELNNRVPEPTISGNIVYTSDLINSGTTGSTVYTNPVTTGNAATVSGWFMWNGNTSTIPISINGYSLWFSGSNVGLNSGNVDLQGISSSGFAGVWKYITVEFIEGAYGKMYINGVLQTLSKKNTNGYNSTPRTPVGGRLYIFNPNYTDFGSVKSLRIFNRSLTQAEVTALYNSENAATNRPKLQSIKSRPDFFKDGSNIATYLFNGDVKDANGTYNGTASNVTYADGKFGQSIQFSGVSDSSFATIKNWDGLGDYSLSLWVYKDRAIVGETIFGRYQSSFGSTGNIFGLLTDIDGSWSFINEYSREAYVNTASNIQIPLNTWTHLSVVFVGTTVNIYTNGILSGTNTSSNWNLGARIKSSAPLYLGRPYVLDANTAHNMFKGKIDTLRIFNRALNNLEVQALYNEHPSVEDQYKLVESSNSAKVLTKNGNPLIRHETENGPAINFVNNRDYFTTPGTSDFAFGTGDFTCEAWVKFTTQPTSTLAQYLCGLDTTGGIGFGYESGNFVFGTRAVTFDINYAHVPTVGVWYHLAATRQSGTMRLFINGVQVASKTNTKNLSISTGTFYIGAFTPNYADNFYGWMKHLHIINGVAKYTGNFTPVFNLIKTPETVLLVEVQKPTFNTDKISKIELTTTDTSGLPIKVKDNRAKDPFGDKSCVASYLFDSNCDDEVNGLSGLYGTTNINLSYGEGKTAGSKALLFNGSNSSLTLSKPLIGTNTTYNFSFDFKVDNDNTCSTIYSENGGGGGVWPYIIIDFFTNNILRLNLHNGSIWINYTIGTNILKNKWYNLVINCNTTNLNVYIDGIKTYSGTTIVQAFQTKNLSYGFGYAGNGQIIDKTFKGSISNLKIFNRALTQDEVSYLYNEKALVTEVTPVSTPVNSLYSNKYTFTTNEPAQKFYLDTNSTSRISNLTFKTYTGSDVSKQGYRVYPNITIKDRPEYDTTNTPASKKYYLGAKYKRNILDILQQGLKSKRSIYNLKNMYLVNDQTIQTLNKINILLENTNMIKLTERLYSNGIFEKVNAEYILENLTQTGTGQNSKIGTILKDSLLIDYSTTFSQSEIDNLEANLNTFKNRARVTPGLVSVVNNKFKLQLPKTLDDGNRTGPGTGTEMRDNLLVFGSPSNIDKYGMAAQNGGSLPHSHIVKRDTPLNLDDLVLGNPVLEDSTGKVKMVTNGYLHQGILFENGELYTRGYNTDGQLGNGNEDSNATSHYNFNLVNIDISLVSMSGHTTQIVKNNRIYGCGYDLGTLGLGSTNEGRPGWNLAPFTPTSQIVKILTTYDCSYCLLENGDLYFTGNNSYYKAGLGHYNDILYYTKIYSGVKDFCGSSYGTYIIDINNDLYYSGLKSYGFPGNGVLLTGVDQTKCYTTFLKVASNVKKVFSEDFAGTGRSTLCALYIDINNDLYYTGTGNGFTWSSNTWVKKASNIKNVIIGHQNIGVMDNNNDIYLIGQNLESIFGITQASNTSLVKIDSNIDLLPDKIASYGYSGSSNSLTYIKDGKIIINGRSTYMHSFIHINSAEIIKPLLPKSFKSLQTDYKQQIPFTVIPLSTNVDDTNIPVFENLTDITGFSSNSDIIIDVPSTL